MRSGKVAGGRRSGVDGQGIVRDGHMASAGEEKVAGEPEVKSDKKVAPAKAK